MGNSVANPVDATPDLSSSTRNRRRRLRHRVHTPAYTALKSPDKSPSVTLHEILNISEDGLKIQSSTALSLNETVDMSVDLSETGVKIHTLGRIVWLGEDKAGISFSQISAEDVVSLKQWLFVNVASACGDQAADNKSEAEVRADNTLLEKHEIDDFSFPADYTSTLTALAAVRREIAARSDSLQQALQLAAERALAFTHATGAALGLSNGSEILCCGTAGSAPSLGVRFRADTGFSGECVRAATTLRCDDAESDPFADTEACRALGLRSMIAVPICRDDSVIGLIEVFSPRPCAFSVQDEMVVERLAEMVAPLVDQPPLEAGDLPQSVAPLADDEVIPSPAEDASSLPFSTGHRLLLTAGALTVLASVVWLLQPWHPKSVSTLRDSSQAQRQLTANSPDLQSGSQSFAGMLKLAEQGDAAAQFAVGAHYATGEDTPQDYAEAARWFGKAAEQGHIAAQSSLGDYYWSGRGVPKDLSKAYFWAVLAQTGGDEASKYRVAFISSQMSRAQIAAAQQKASDWIKQHESFPAAIASSEPK